MSELLVRMNKTLTPEQKKLARVLTRETKKLLVTEKVLLIRDTLRAVAGRGNTELRYLLGRNVWSATEALAVHFDEIGGNEFVRSVSRTMFQDVSINDRELVRLEHETLVKFLGADTVSKLRLGPRNLQLYANDAAESKALRFITNTWTLHGEMAKCGCRPTAAGILDSELALYNFFKWVVLAALVAADLLAFSNPATAPLGAVSLTTAAVLARRAC